MLDRMNPANSQSSPGRPIKDAALRVRDSYWAIRLKQLAHGRSYASVERVLFPHITLRVRGNGEGVSQPFALSKVANGSRGICPELDAVPLVVRRAQEHFPGSLDDFRSLLWPVLLEARRRESVRIADWVIADEVLGRLKDEHFAKEGRRALSLNQRGICLLASLSHRDALAVLLLNSPKLAGVSKVSVLAEGYVTPVFVRLCAADPAFAAVSERVGAIINSRFPGSLRLNNPSDYCAFPRRRVSAMSVSLRMLLGP